MARWGWLLNLVTRYRIVGAEVVGVGAFVLALAFLEQSEARASSVVASFTWVWAIVGITLLLVGFETMALDRLSPPPKT